MTVSHERDLASKRELQRITKASRIAAFSSAAGAVIVFASLVFASNRLASLHAQEQELRLQNRRLQETAAAARNEVAKLQSRIEQLQCALANSRSAINAFHARDYATAISLYDRALTCDPDNAYLLNLKAYSQFKLRRYEEAIATQRRSLSIDPNYAWGYFDLARFQCAAGFASAAQESAESAVRLRPELREEMRADGEFQRLCGKSIRIPE